jgi:hypothetical protein
MRAIVMSRTVATLGALILAGACTDTSGPTPPLPPGGETMTVVPRSATLRPGQVVALKAQLIDADGNAMEEVAISWRSSDDAVATVAATGEVYGRSEGRAVISASAQGRSQIASIRVLQREQKPESKPTPEPLFARRKG